MVMAPLIRKLTDYLNTQTRSCLQISAAVVKQYGRTIDIYIDSWDVSDNSDNIGRKYIRDNKQEPTCLQDISTVCISNSHYL